ncbi:MAG TPA: AglZ/HisF2 family acetamidino modification protein [Bryobacteraceae bacterium]|nr:AglZ/HisF2 family acetamidino modification protein [Bryobacteraceae bacterium]
MLRTRVIPCLLLRDGGLVKTVRFKDATYVGDPINAVRIFNEKEVDELAFLDIGATPSGAGPNFELLADIASEAFIPFGYGGGITTIEQVRRLFSLGVEKVILNTAAARTPALVEEAAAAAGSSSVVVSVDVRRNWRGKPTVMINGGRDGIDREPIEYAREMERRGAGEILLNSIDRDGTQAGYDLDLIHAVADAVSVPVVAAGGAGNLTHFREAVDAGASAVAAGSLFVFHGKHRAVLITYPLYEQLERLFSAPCATEVR